MAIAEPHVDERQYETLCAHLARKNVPDTLNDLLLQLENAAPDGKTRHDLAIVKHGGIITYHSMYQNNPTLTFSRLQEESEIHFDILTHAIYLAVTQLSMKV